MTLQEQITAVKREIVMRKMVYPRRVETKKMKPEKAEFEIAAMEAVLATLEVLEPLTPQIMPFSSDWARFHNHLFPAAELP